MDSRMNQVVEEEIEVTNPQGVHVRPSDMIGKTAIHFRSHITIAHGTDVADARSPVSLVGLGAGVGNRLKIRAEGPDADAAVKAIAALFRGNFNE
jgi:phosphotransferase system HPr (HPr) family protein